MPGTNALAYPKTGQNWVFPTVSFTTDAKSVLAQRSHTRTFSALSVKHQISSSKAIVWIHISEAVMRSYLRASKCKRNMYTSLSGMIELTKKIVYWCKFFEEMCRKYIKQELCLWNTMPPAAQLWSHIFYLWPWRMTLTFHHSKCAAPWHTHACPPYGLSVVVVAIEWIRFWHCDLDLWPSDLKINRGHLRSLMPLAWNMPAPRAAPCSKDRYKNSARAFQSHLFRTLTLVLNQIWLCRWLQLAQLAKRKKSRP